MPAEGFTLKLGEGEQRVSIDALKEALENALDLLRNVGQEFAPAGTVVRWEVVAASLRSPLSMTFAPRSQGTGKLSRAVGKRIVAACVHGLGQLEKKPVLPPHFNEEALLAVQRLVKVALKENAKITVASNGTVGVTPTARTTENIKKVVEKARLYVDYGTIEGRLEEISIHGPTRFAVWDELTDARTDCLIGDDRLGEAMELLRMRKRVAVSGRIHYRNQQPKTVEVEEIRTLRGMDDILKLEDIPPMDITGGLSSEEYIRRMRDAQ
jgi:nucleotide-binding universal stress UspA family protein